MCQKTGQKVGELHQCNRGREIRAERQADPIRGKQIKNLGSRIPERCGTDQSGRASRGADQGEPPASTSKSRGRAIPEELEREKAGGVLKIY